MKKLVFILILSAAAAVSYGQAGYTRINSRYNWLGGLFDALGVPAGGSAAFQTGQLPKAGAIYYDSTGVDSGLYVWSGLAWRLQGATPTPTLQQVLDVGNTTTGTAIFLHNANVIFEYNGLFPSFQNGLTLTSGTSQPASLNNYIHGSPLYNYAFRFTPGNSNTAAADFDGVNLTDYRRYLLPDASGTLALTSDIPAVPTIQQVLTQGNIATSINMDFVSGSISFTNAGYGLIFNNGGGNTVYLLAGGTDAIRFVQDAGVNYVQLDNSLLTASRTQKYPDKAGTFAMTSDIPGGAGIDDVLAVGQALTAARTVTQAGFRMTYTGGDLWADNFTGTSTSTSGTGINSNGVFDIRRTITAAGNHRGFFDGTYFDNSTVSTHSYAAFDVKDTIFVGSGSTSDHTISFQSRPLKLGDGTLTHLYNFGAATPKISAGTVTNMYGLYYFSPQITGTGVLTNNYGVYIPTLTGATNNYGGYFANNVGFGTATPAMPIHVVGTPRFVTGNQGNLKLLQSDADGDGDWVTANSTLVGLGNVDNTSDATKNAAAVTLTNKRITRRVTTIASSATPTPDSDASDMFTVSAQAAGAVFAAPTGTPTEGQGLIIRIKDNGGAQTLGFNAIYRAGDISLPTTTVAGKFIYLGFIYNFASTTWDLVSKIDNF